MNKKKIAVLLSFILTVCSLGPAAIPSRALAAEAAAQSENAVEANEYDGGERTGDDVLKETVSLNGETGTVSEDVPEAAVSDESCEGAARELIQRLEEKGMTRNSGGWYEYTDENGETWSYDPEDPETTMEFIPRETLRRVSTPQAYRYDLLSSAYERAFAENIGVQGSHYTNTMMVELGYRLYFAAGSDKNIKLTTKDDLELFKAYLAADADTWLK